MAAVVSLESLGKELKDLLECLPGGESVTVVGTDGKPVAILSTVKPVPESTMSDEELFAQWEELAVEISKAWKSENSAVETLAEMRR